MITRRTFLYGLAVTAGWGLVHGCGPRVVRNTVRIGAIYPLSGPLASVGANLHEAVRLAVDLVNNRHDLALPLAAESGLPGLGGRLIEVVFADHQGDPAKGAAETERLVSMERVHALIGCYNSSVTKTASRIAEQYGVPFVCLTSTSPELVERGFRWFFRTTPDDRTYARDMMRFLREFIDRGSLPADLRIGILHENTDFGVTAARTQMEIAAEFGLKNQIVLQLAYDSRTTNFTSEILKLKQARVNVVIPSSYTKDAILFIRTLREQGYRPLMVLANDAGYTQPEFVREVGHLADGLLSRAAFNADLGDRIPRARQVNQLYRQRARKDLDETSARALQGTLALAVAINRAGALAPEAIRRALLDLDLGPDQVFMPWDGIRFDPRTQQNVRARGIIIQLIDRRWYTVYPAAFATLQPLLGPRVK